MIKIIKRIYLLTWKNWIIQKRNIQQTISEIGIPIIFASLLILIRLLIEPRDAVKPTIYAPLNPLNLSEFYTMIEDEHMHMILAYQPQTELLDQLLNKARGYMMKEILSLRRSFLPKEVNNLTVVGFKDQDALMQFVFDNDPLAAIEFPSNYRDLNDTDDLKHLHFTLRFMKLMRVQSKTEVIINPPCGWCTKRIFPIFQLPGPRHNWSHTGGLQPGYFHEGFLPVQAAISKAFIDMKTGGMLGQILRCDASRIHHTLMIHI